MKSCVSDSIFVALSLEVDTKTGITKPDGEILVPYLLAGSEMCSVCERLTWDKNEVNSLMIKKLLRENSEISICAE